MRKRIILTCVLCFFLHLSALIVTRDEIITKSQGYANYIWIVNTPNSRYAIYSITGTEITGVAYSYGDKDDTLKFQTDIDNGLIPRNWKSETSDDPANPSSSYTGIDCSGLLKDCWKSNTEVLDNMISECVEIIQTELKNGDACRGPGHVQIYAWNDSVFEAVGSDNLNDYNSHRVKISKRNDRYTPYSIFPQFSECTPKDRSTVAENDIEIGVTVRCKGAITQSGTVIKLNGNEEKIFYIDEINDILILLTIQSV